ncbi:MAG: anti-sigma factor [Erythrobacter sp.]|jgi:anti-sigma-K factor RskA|nr:anti-sigma factor [Erythrobacter sp.]
MEHDETRIEDDPFLLAGAYALGALEGEERADAQRAHLSDPRFREAAAWWERRLAAMAEATPAFTPAPQTWAAIEARIDTIEAQDKGGGISSTALTAQQLASVSRPAGWSIAMALAGAGMAAAAISLYVAAPAPSLAPSAPSVAALPAPQLVVQLQDEEAQRRLVGRYDDRSRQLALSIAGLEAEAGQTPELWVIPEGGAPVSLGAIPETGAFARVLDQSEASLLIGGATLAVTFEEDSGVRHEAPSPPILLAGELTQV